LNEPQFQIETSDYQCCGCEKEISCGSRYFSTVVFEDAAFRRRNYCDPCWAGAQNARTAGAEELYAYWRTCRPEPPGADPRRMRFDPALVLEFFRRLSAPAGEPGDAGRAADAEAMGPAEPQKRDLRFVLALLLVRKKALHFDSSVERNGGEWLRLTERGDRSRVYWVENPDLTDEQLGRVRDDIGELLHMQI
jgi:hypothetical protein